jgi:hypothetical protein
MLSSLLNWQGRIWAASSGLFPSIYLPALGNNTQSRYTNADYVSGVTEETMRLKAKFAPTAAVIPYAWNYYHDVNYMLLVSACHSCPLYRAIHITQACATPRHFHVHGTGGGHEGIAGEPAAGRCGRSRAMGEPLSNANSGYTGIRQRHTGSNVPIRRQHRVRVCCRTV